MNHPVSTVAYYNQVSPIGKPILDLLCIECKESCIATLLSLQSDGWGFCSLTAVKYLWRLGQKTEDYSDDIVKAIQYFEWASENEFDLPNFDIDRWGNIGFAILELDKLLRTMKNDTI